MGDGPRRELKERGKSASSSGGRLLRLTARKHSTDASTQPGQSSRGPTSGRWDASRLPLVEPGSYDVAGELAHGGIGRILKGRDQRLGRAVALKELLEGGGAAEERFVREALVTARLQHPSIVPVYEAGRWPTGEPFYAMKLVSGRSLDEVIATARTLDQRLALLPHVLAVAEAVAYAHSERIIHRDLKPSNVLVGAFGETVVIDWGLAKDLDEQRALGPDAGGDAKAPPSRRLIPTDITVDDGAPGPESTTGTLMSRGGPIESNGVSSSGEPGLTIAGAVLGTPSYMPPEQAAGESVDERADVYAVGAILYHVLAGAAPYTGKTSLEILKKTLAGPPPPLEKKQRGVPQDLVTIVNKAMARAIADRYPTAKELADDLRRFQTGQIVGAHKYSRLERLVRFGRRHRAAVGVAGAALVVLAVVAFVSVRGIVDARNRAEQERDRAAQKQAEAEAARGEAMLRADELTLAQARDLAPRDPNKAIALLQTLSPAFSRWGVARTIAADARAHGLARVVRHSASVNGAALSPDGSKLATACDDKIVRVIDLKTGHAHEFAGHTDEVYWLAFSQDGRRLASHGKDETLREWDLEAGTGRVVAPEVWQPIANADLSLYSSLSRGKVVLIDGPTGAKKELSQGEVYWSRYAFSPSSSVDAKNKPSNTNPNTNRPTITKRVAFSTRGKLAVLDIESGRVKRFPGQKKPYRALGMAPGGELLAAGDDSGLIRLFDLSTGAERALTGHKAEPTHLVFSPDGKTLVSASNDRTLRFWDVASGASREVQGHDGQVRDLRFSRDGRTVVSGGTDRTMRVWDASGRNARVLRGFEDMVFKVSISPDGGTVAGGSADHTARVWDLAAMGERLAAAHAGAVVALAVSPDGKHIASASVDGEARLTDVSSVLAESAAIAPPGANGERGLRGRKSASAQVLFSPDGRRLARALDDGAVEVWAIPGGGDPIELQGNTGRVEVLLFSQDGNVLYSGGQDKTVRRWELDSGADRATGSVLYEHAGAVTELALSPDGARLASGSRDHTLRVWDLREGRGQTFSGHTQGLTSVIFSPDGKRILTGSDDHTVRVWDPSRGALETHSVAGPMLDMVFAPDEKSFYLRGFTNAFHRWDAATRKPLDIFRGHTAPIWDLALSPDGRRAATASSDRTARIFDSGTGESRALVGHWDELKKVAYMPDGRSVVSSGADGMVRLWLDDLPESAEELRAWLKAAVPEAIEIGAEEGTP